MAETEIMTLEKGSMAFKLKSGHTLFITPEDVQDISNKIILETITNHSHKVIINRDESVKRADMMYKIVTEQDGKMSEEVKENYLKSILVLLQAGESVSTTLEAEVENNKGKK